MTLTSGTIVGGRYKIMRLIGEGASGAVYLARDTRDRGRTWAIKELWAEAEPEAEDIFRNEIRMLRQLRHPAIPTLEDAFDIGEHRYLVMERIEGPTLERVREEAGRPLLESEVVGWGIQLCDVLDYLHTRNPPVLYRDLKPSNCMLTRGNIVKIVDLGIARRFNPQRARDTHIFGTPGFCAPEQYHGHTYAASDLYALGATLYVLLSECQPETFRFVFPPIRRLNSAISAVTEEILVCALHTDPGQRFSDAVGMKKALELAAARAHTGVFGFVKNLFGQI